MAAKIAIRLLGTVPDESGEKEPAGVNAWTGKSQFLECDVEVRRPASSRENEGCGTSPGPTTGNTGNTNDTEDKIRAEILYRYERFLPMIHPSFDAEGGIVLLVRH